MHWGRVASDGTILEVIAKSLLVLVDSIRVAIWVKKDTYELDSW